MIIYGNLKKNYREALDFFVATLFSRQMYKHLSVKVAFKNNLDTIHGLIYIDDYNTTGKPRSFVIEVNRKDPENEIIQTLAHEVVHMRQYVYGHLNENMSYWKGKKVNSDKINYFDQPWEIEAIAVGNLLYDLFVLKKQVEQFHKLL